MATNYSLDWTDPTLKSPLVVNGETINTSLTSLAYIGKNAKLWGNKITEDLIHLLENFASQSTAPSNPTIGQRWFKAEDKYLRVRIGSSYKMLAYRRVDSATTPQGVFYHGDLWYDTTLNILRVYTNNGTWVPVCAQC